MRINLNTLCGWSLLPQFYFYLRAVRRSLYLVSGFTLIELLIVIAIIGVLAGGVVVAINPLAKIQDARDAQRKTDISGIAGALEEYAIFKDGFFPGERFCDSSIGSNDSGCPVNPPESNWSNTSSIYVGLVSRGSLKRLPKDPVNNSTYYYNYEPSGQNQGPCPDIPIPAPCSYWIGAKLEHPSSPSKAYFRCSDNTTLAAGVGCKEVPGWEQ